MVVSSVHLCAFMNPLDDQFSLEPLIARNPTQQCKRKWDHTKCLARKQTYDLQVLLICIKKPLRLQLN